MKPIIFTITRRNVGELTRKRETLDCKTDYSNGRKAAETIFNFIRKTIQDNEQNGMEVERATILLPERDVEFKMPSYRIPSLREDDIMQTIAFLRGW